MEFKAQLENTSTYMCLSQNVFCQLDTNAYIETKGNGKLFKANMGSSRVYFTLLVAAGTNNKNTSFKNFVGLAMWSLWELYE